jgi:hypothetical protein
MSLLFVLICANLPVATQKRRRPGHKIQAKRLFIANAKY